MRCWLRVKSENDATEIRPVISEEMVGFWNGIVLVAEFRFFVFFGLHLRHMEVPRLRIKSELQLPAYSTACSCQPAAASLQHTHTSSKLRL